MSRAIAAALALLSNAQAKAAVLTSAMGAAGASVAHADPWPWVVSALGALVVIVKFPATTRANGMTNAVISVMTGGLGSSAAAEAVAQHAGIAPGQLLCAFALSALWPAGVAAVQQLWPALRRRAERGIEGGSQ